MLLGRYFGVCWVSSNVRWLSFGRLCFDNKISNYIEGIQEMQQPKQSQAETVNPIIKLVKQRQDLYFQLLAFVNSNLQSSSNDLDNTTIFNKFIAIITQKHSSLRKKQQSFVQSFNDQFAEAEDYQDDPVSKEMLRLSSRLMEILEASISRVRKSVFQDSGRAVREFSRFKSTLNKILKRDCFVVKDFVEHFINYSLNKYKKQFIKLQKYVEKLLSGDDIWFRELYCQEKSDVQVSPQRLPKQQEKTVQKLSKKLDMTEHLSSTEQPQKKVSPLKKTVKPSTSKKRERLLHIKKKSREDFQEPLNQQQTATKLYKFYMLLQLNKKQFLEDFKYEKMQEQKHKAMLMAKLLDRNKLINSQINGFVAKSSNYLPIPQLLPQQKSSGDERNQSVASKLSLRTSFIISKRKSSFQLDSGSQKPSDIEKMIEPLSRTVRNVNPRRRSSHSNARNNPQKSNKKLFVVKAPMVFEQQVIPQAQMTQTQWLQAPLSVKVRDKKMDNIRLKRKNNVNPMENAFLPQNFRYF